MAEPGVGRCHEAGPARKRPMKVIPDLHLRQGHRPVQGDPGGCLGLPARGRDDALPVGAKQTQFRFGRSAGQGPVAPNKANSLSGGVPADRPRSDSVKQSQSAGSTAWNGAAVASNKANFPVFGREMRIWDGQQGYCQRPDGSALRREALPRRWAWHGWPRNRSRGGTQWRQTKPISTALAWRQPIAPNKPNSGRPCETGRREAVASNKANSLLGGEAPADRARSDSVKQSQCAGLVQIAVTDFHFLAQILRFTQDDGLNEWLSC